jgi:hypothetical protein
MQQSMIIQTISFGKIRYVESLNDKTVNLTPIKSKAHVFHDLTKAKQARDMALEKDNKVCLIRFQYAKEINKRTSNNHL